MSATDTSGGIQDASVAELVRQLSEQTSRLARQEVQLAKAELEVKAKRAGLGAGMFGAAGMVGLYAVGALVACAIAALSLAVATWLAALIIAAVLGAVAGMLALQGRTQVKAATPPVPEQASESSKQDFEWVKTKAQAGRS